MNDVLLFLSEWQWWILFAVLVIIAIYFLRKILLKRQRILEKSWIYTLFFLTKRQMMIPLIYTLIEKHGRGHDDELIELIHLRKKAREKNLRDHPQDRLRLEETVSRVIYGYFMELDKAGILDKDKKLMRIAEDLEFIDEKLVVLQNMYNSGVQAWNWKARSFFWMRPLGIRTFEVFE